MRRHPQLLHLCHLRPAAAIAARCWHHHASLSHEPRGHSHCRARPAWPNRHLVGAHRGHPQPQPDRCACVQCGRWWLGRAAESWPCAGDVARHGWPVLWRQSSRSAPRPWLRGCLQAAPRDPGSGVRCVYRSSYGYTRVYWSQLPAVGAFGRVWWPWRTMRTQKVAFLNYRGSPRFGNSLMSSSKLVRSTHLGDLSTCTVTDYGQVTLLEHCPLVILGTHTVVTHSTVRRAQFVVRSWAPSPIGKNSLYIPYNNIIQCGG